MTLATDGVGTQQLNLPEELILMLLNEESGYFRQIAGWDLKCAVAGAALAELSFVSRIVTDMESLFLLDETETGDHALDPILKEIAAATGQHIDRYLPPRNEHHSPGYAPFGLGTHTCLGSRWMELQLVIDLMMMIAHYFTLQVPPQTTN